MKRRWSLNVRSPIRDWKPLGSQDLNVLIAEDRTEDPRLEEDLGKSGEYISLYGRKTSYASIIYVAKNICFRK